VVFATLPFGDRLVKVKDSEHHAYLLPEVGKGGRLCKLRAFGCLGRVLWGGGGTALLLDLHASEGEGCPEQAPFGRRASPATVEIPCGGIGRGTSSSSTCRPRASTLWSSRASTLWSSCFASYGRNTLRRNRGRLGTSDLRMP
jgi:hypothetical protein